MRTTVLALLMVFGILTCHAQEKVIRLPEPDVTGGIPLMAALNARQSVRSFAVTELDLQTLSELLWAGCGYNRREARKRTAPSSMNFQEIEIFVALKTGLYRYNAWDNTLEMIHDRDIRAATGTQQYVATAPVNLIYVADQKKLRDPGSDYQQKASYANTGFISQNVYLYCASAGLATVVRAYYDNDTLMKAMGLGPDMKIILTQTVGYPSEEAKKSE